MLRHLAAEGESLRKQRRGLETYLQARGYHDLSPSAAKAHSLTFAGADFLPPPRPAPSATAFAGASPEPHLAYRSPVPAAGPALLHPEWFTRRAEEIARDLPQHLDRELERIQRTYHVVPPASDAHFKDMAYDWLKSEKDRVRQQEAELQAKEVHILRLLEAQTVVVEQHHKQQQQELRLAWEQQQRELQAALAQLHAQLAQQQRAAVEFEAMQRERLARLDAKEAEGEALLRRLREREDAVAKREQLFEEFIRARLTFADRKEQQLWDAVVRGEARSPVRPPSLGSEHSEDGDAGEYYARRPRPGRLTDDSLRVHPTRSPSRSQNGHRDGATAAARYPPSSATEDTETNTYTANQDDMRAPVPRTPQYVHPNTSKKRQHTHAPDHCPSCHRQRDPPDPPSPALPTSPPPPARPARHPRPPPAPAFPPDPGAGSGASEGPYSVVGAAASPPLQPQTVLDVYQVWEQAKLAATQHLAQLYLQKQLQPPAEAYPAAPPPPGPTPPASQMAPPFVV